MITVIVQFILSKPITFNEARKKFLSTAAKYQNVNGLIQKTYIHSDDGLTVGGVYLWESKKEAQKLYTEEWFKFVLDKYGTKANVTYFESPVIVDNKAHEIFVDQS